MRLLVCLVGLSACGRVAFDGVADGSSDTPGTAARLAYTTDDFDAVLNVTTFSLRPTYTGRTPRFSIAPALPAGVTIDDTTGEISGTASEVRDAVPYVVTASATTGEPLATFALTLTVLPGYAVTTTADGPDDNGGVDTTCMSTVASGCSLRAAVQTANLHPNKQLIMLLTGTYVLTNTLDVGPSDLVIAGQGATLTRVHPANVHPGYGMTLLQMNRTITLKKIAFDEFGPRDGGVIAATAGTVIVDACSFTNNQSAGSGGVLFVSGGAQAKLTRSTFSANTSYGGNGWGGVIDGEGPVTHIDVIGCTAIANEAPWGSFSHITTGTTLLLQNSTLYGNKSTIAGTLATPGGIYTLINDTIVGNTNTNTNPDSAGIYLYNAPCHYTVANTIVAFNTDVNSAPHNCNRRDLTTSLTSNGGNLFSDSAENCGAYFTAPGDHLMTDPLLSPGAPMDNGGPTATILPRAGSPALALGQACPAIDQRGQPRPAAGCDAGAVELP